MKLINGTFNDYKVLASYHYLDRPYYITSVYSLVKDNIIIGVLVAGLPYPNCRARDKRINKMNITSIKRIVILPKYRHNGYATLMLKEFLKVAKTKYVEIIAKEQLEPLFKNAGFKTKRYINYKNEKKVYAISSRQNDACSRQNGIFREVLRVYDENEPVEFGATYSEAYPDDCGLDIYGD